MNVAFTDWVKTVQMQCEATLERLLPSTQQVPARLHEAMRYATLGGGKRIRPLLAVAAGELTEARAEHALLAGSTVEMIHAYSLVHDDLPCMDDDALRRGKPSCHMQYDEATALLVGDALQTLAFDCLSRSTFVSPAQQLEMVGVLAAMSGSCGMAGGQAIDLAAVGKKLTLPEQELMHALKTGALIRAAVLLGALCGTPMQPSERQALEHFAKHAGLLFQVVDDILDCTATTAALGKTAGKDAETDKPTYVSLMGLSAARDFAEELRYEALSALELFAAKAQRLIELTDFIARRTY